MAVNGDEFIKLNVILSYGTRTVLQWQIERRLVRRRYIIRFGTRTYRTARLPVPENQQSDDDRQQFI